MTYEGYPAAPLRLLVDGHTFDVGPQGTTTFLAGLLNALPDALRQVTGRELILLCATSDPGAAARFLEVEHVRVPMGGGFARRNLLHLPRLSREHRADLTLSQYVRPLRLHGLSACVIHDVLFLDYPALFPWAYRISRQVLFGWSARHSDLVATVSDYSRERIAHWFGLASDRIALVRNGVEPPPRAKAPAPRRRSAATRLLFVSRLERRKRQDWCIMAARDLAELGMAVELHLVGSGSGSYADAIMAEAANARNEGVAVHLHHGIGRTELATLMAATDIVLFPSACEGFGIPVIEGAAAGIPCVVAHNTALAELAPYIVGRMFDDSAYGHFFDALRGAIAELPLLTAEARVRAASAAEAFSWRSTAEAFVSALVRKGIA